MATASYSKQQENDLKCRPIFIDRRPRFGRLQLFPYEAEKAIETLGIIIVARARRL